MKCPIDQSECLRVRSCVDCDRVLNPKEDFPISEEQAAEAREATNFQPSPPPADDRNDPAEPCSGGSDATHDFGGFTKLQRACLDLRLPESGTPWLDKLIARKRLEDVAARIAATLIANLPVVDRHSRIAPIADMTGQYKDIADSAAWIAAALINRTNPPIE